MTSKKAKDLLPARLAALLALENGSRANLGLSEAEDIRALSDVAANAPNSVVGQVVRYLRGELAERDLPMHVRALAADARQRLTVIEREVKVDGLSDVAIVDAELAGALHAAVGISVPQFARELAKQDAAGREAAFELVVSGVEQKAGGLASGALRLLKDAVMAAAELHAMGAVPPEPRLLGGEQGQTAQALRQWKLQQDSHAERVRQAREIRQLLRNGKDLEAPSL